jgi:hypothetical protein
MFVKRTWFLDTRICWLVLAAFCCLSLIPVDGTAALTESRLSDGSSLSSRTEMIETVRRALERDVVAQRLADYGLTKEEVAEKLPSMTDEQLHQLAGLSNSLGEGGILELVIGVLLVILLVVVILKLTNKQVIIK